MTVAPLQDYSRLCLHTITTKPWSLTEALKHYQAAGVKGITVWRQALEGAPLEESGKRIADSGLELVSLCRGGFFPALSATDRQKAIDENRAIIDEAAAIGAPLIVLVCGADPGQSLDESRKQIQEGIAAVLPHAQQANVKLAIEPLHPMYADTRSAVNTLGQANDMVQALNHPHIGVTVDVYHLWWDPQLEAEIARAGDKIFSYHVCDWRNPTRDLLLDRGIMGEGCIPLRAIREWVEKTGFDGYIEVEIFSEELWAQDQHDLLARIQKAYLDHV